MKLVKAGALVAVALMMTAWGPVKIPAPSELVSPTPIEGTTGKYMSPFTSDGVTAEWVTKSMKVKASSAIGGMAGQYAGQKAAERVPFVGGMLGKSLGQKAGRSMALQSIGGAEFLTLTSDLSFDSVQQMAVFMYVNYSTRADYQQILDATYAIYPELQPAYTPALQSATRK